MSSLSYFQQIERVRAKALPLWRTMKSQTWLDFINKGEVEPVGERGFLIPAETNMNGRFGTMNLQGGDAGRGSTPEGVVMSEGYYPFRLNFEFDKLSLMATANKQVAVGSSPLVRTLTYGFTEFRRMRDKAAHNDGTAVLANALAHSSSSGVSVYTLDAIYGAQRLARGQYITVYDSTLATLKSAGVLRITGVNTTGTAITLSGVVPSAANTDAICYEGVSGTSPTGPRGLEYWSSYATSGYTGGLDRSAEPQLIAKSVNASSAPYDVQHVMGVYDQILNDRGEVGDLMALCAPAQRAAAFNNTMAIQNILLDSTTAQAVDRLPSLKGRNAFMYGGVPHTLDIHHNKTTVDFTIPSDWGKAVLAEEDFFRTDGVAGERGQFIQVYGASGGPAAATWLGYLCAENYYDINPGRGGIVYGLPLAQFHS
jgi:hypothetical protein